MYGSWKREKKFMNTKMANWTKLSWVIISPWTKPDSVRLFRTFCYFKRERQCRTVGQIRKKCKETLNLMWLSLIWFISFLFVCSNLFCTVANFRIKCVTETKLVSVLFYKNLKSSFPTWLTHLTKVSLHSWLHSGPRCGASHNWLKAFLMDHV